VSLDRHAQQQEIGLSQFASHMVSTIHQKQSSKVKTTLFIPITIKVNTMTVKKGVFTSTPNPKP